MVWALSRRGVQLLVVTIVLSLGFVWVGSWTTTTSYEFRDSFANKDWSGPPHLSSLGPVTSTLVIDASFIVERLVPGMQLFQTAPANTGIRAEFNESGRLVAFLERPGGVPLEIQLLEDVVPGRHYRIVLALDNASMLRVNVGGQDTKTLTIGQTSVALADIRSGYGQDAIGSEFEGRIDQFGVLLEANSPIVDGTMRLLGQLVLALLATTGVVVMALQLAESRLRESRPEGR
jgi:hypothetical protein